MEWVLIKVYVCRGVFLEGVCACVCEEGPMCE